MSDGRRLRVGVNLCWMVPGVVGGSEDAVTTALAAVADRSDVELVLFVLPSFEAAHPALAARAAALVVAPVGGGSRPRRVLAETTWLRRAGRDADVSLMHHAGGVVPLCWPGPCTVTIHDLQPLEHPEHFGPVKRWYLRAMSGRSARRARRVAVPSRFVRDTVVRRLGVEAGCVDVVPWSVPAPPADPGVEHLPAALRSVPYALYPAITYAHKGHDVLVEAMAGLADTDLHLVLTGAEGPVEEAVAARIESSPARERIHRLGRVSRPVLEALYRHATVVAVPSRYEGFGLPALEALVRGCPLVVSDHPALAEVVPAEVPRVPCGDVEAWTAALRTMALDAGRRAAVAAAGPRRAAELAPDATAAAQVASWRAALEVER